MQQHHSLSRITDQGDCHLLGTHSLPSTTNISSFILQNFLLRSANASIFHETSAQRRQGLIANKWLSQKLKFTCTHVQILHWPKSSFGFLGTCHGKTRMNFLANPVETTGDSNNNHIKHNFTLLEGPFPGSLFNPITNWDT